MRKHRWLPIVLAAAVIAACCGGIELSQFVLDDYRDEVEEITEERDPGAFYLDYRENDVLWPWNLYEEGLAEPVTDPVLQDRASQIAETLLGDYSGVWLNGSCSAGASLEVIPAGSADRGTAGETDAAARAAADADRDADGEARDGRNAVDEQILDPAFVEGEYDPYSEMSRVFDGDLYFVHDYKFLSADGREYVLNLAYTENAVLYWSCVSEEDRDSSFEDINDACEFLNYQYTDMRGGGYGVGYDTGLNCFYSHEQRLETACTDLDWMFPMNWNVLAVHQGLIEGGSSSGVSSDGSILNLEFYGSFDETYRLVLFFSPSAGQFAGFSLRQG